MNSLIQRAQLWLCPQCGWHRKREVRPGPCSLVAESREGWADYGTVRVSLSVVRTQSYTSVSIHLWLLFCYNSELSRMYSLQNIPSWPPTGNLQAYTQLPVKTIPLQTHSHLLLSRRAQKQWHPGSPDPDAEQPSHTARNQAPWKKWLILEPQQRQDVPGTKCCEEVKKYSKDVRDAPVNRTQEPDKGLPNGQIWGNLTEIYTATVKDYNQLNQELVWTDDRWREGRERRKDRQKQWTCPLQQNVRQSM